MKTKQILPIVIICVALLVVGSAFLRMNREDNPKNKADKIMVEDSDAKLETNGDGEYETLVEKAEKMLPEIGDSMEDVEKLLGEPDDWEKKDSNKDVVSYSYRNHKGVYYRFWFQNDELYHIKTGKGW